MNPLFPDPSKTRNADDMGIPTLVAPPPASQPTPRTDAAVEQADRRQIVAANFARTLERELAVRQKYYAESQDIIHRTGVELAAFRAQLDQANQDIKDLEREIDLLARMD